jgi:hypothetical protein
MMASPGMYLPYLTDPEPSDGYSQNFVQLKIASNNAPNIGSWCKN